MVAKILVVDDELELERLILQRFKKNIRNQKFEFIFARNGKEALETLAHEVPPVDTILTDLRMPEMDGLILLDRIKEIDETLKAVVVSAYGDMVNIRTAMNRGAFDFLTKPIDFRDLEITINKTVEFVTETRKNRQQLRQVRDRLHQRAYSDELTGLANRNAFLDRLQVCVDQFAENPEGLFAVLFLELCRYRMVKYSFGHGLSDRLLIATAKRLKTCLRSTDVLARLGADEFAILLQNIRDDREVQSIADRIHEAMKSPFHLDGSLLFSGVNIGIALGNLGSTQPADFLQSADTAMHYAKDPGNSPTAFFVPAMQENALWRLQLESELQQAIAQEELHLNYQPIIFLPNHSVSGFEALVRWRHPQRGRVFPSEFIPLAEETGLIVPLDNWVLWRAGEQLNRWRSQFPQFWPLSISVNLSEIELSHPSYLALIDRILTENFLSGCSLKIEITERTLMQQSSQINNLISQLKTRGIQLCIDDFGTGYSCLAYLHRLPLDIIKIDRSFINGMETDSKKLDIVKTILTLAETLGFQAIAEGVETAAQLTLLRSLGCPYAQGYLFSKPLEEPAVASFLTAFSSE
ncbi:putative bifunctional diguanylate cyclase/phosphodiesterase [Phormidium sp. CCY1219]|uniref:putative bifunctional diguanylate cyclase/phosphodiesterase n=1 Tax=Phormidium sp. CCY1219 TaxID=2886104 RepID=UPI002D1E5293|nr:EAL domain-containing protein [Phormidium sp. CCY1219]MEB3831594.1 EAL domain-containing protein [Phormidium sp. CCY1219]